MFRNILSGLHIYWSLKLSYMICARVILCVLSRGSKYPGAEPIYLADFQLLVSENNKPIKVAMPVVISFQLHAYCKLSAVNKQ
jgi:hypothetical protein